MMLTMTVARVLCYLLCNVREVTSELDNELGITRLAACLSCVVVDGRSEASRNGNVGSLCQLE